MTRLGLGTGEASVALGTRVPRRDGDAGVRIDRGVAEGEVGGSMEDILALGGSMSGDIFAGAGVVGSTGTISIDILFFVGGVTTFTGTGSDFGGRGTARSGTLAVPLEVTVEGEDGTSAPSFDCPMWSCCVEVDVEVVEDEVVLVGLLRPYRSTTGGESDASLE